MRAGYAVLFAKENFAIDHTKSQASLVIFPEMDANVDVPEITIDCWRILNKSPDDMMCASSRMVVKHRGQATTSVIACTLLPYDSQFDLGPSLETALKSSETEPPALREVLCAPAAAAARPDASYFQASSMRPTLQSASPASFTPLICSPNTA